MGSDGQPNAGLDRTRAARVPPDSRSSKRIADRDGWNRARGTRPANGAFRSREPRDARRRRRWPGRDSLRDDRGRISSCARSRSRSARARRAPVAAKTDARVAIPVPMRGAPAESIRGASRDVRVWHVPAGDVGAGNDGADSRGGHGDGRHFQRVCACKDGVARADQTLFTRSR